MPDTPAPFEDYWILVMPECDEWQQSLGTTLIASFADLQFVVTKDRHSSANALLVKLNEIVEWHLWTNEAGERLMRVAGHLLDETSGRPGPDPAEFVTVDLNYTTRMGTVRIHPNDPGREQWW